MIFSFHNDYFFQGVSDELFKKIHFQTTKAYIDPPLVEDVSKNQEHLHHGLSKSRQSLMAENGHKALVPPSLCAAKGQNPVLVWAHHSSLHTLHKRMALLNAWARL